MIKKSILFVEVFYLLDGQVKKGKIVSDLQGIGDVGEKHSTIMNMWLILMLMTIIGLTGMTDLGPLQPILVPRPPFSCQENAMNQSKYKHILQIEIKYKITVVILYLDHNELVKQCFHSLLALWTRQVAVRLNLVKFTNQYCPCCFS